MSFYLRLNKQKQLTQIILFSSEIVNHFYFDVFNLIVIKVIY